MDAYTITRVFNSLEQVPDEWTTLFVKPPIDTFRSAKFDNVFKKFFPRRPELKLPPVVEPIRMLTLLRGSLIHLNKSLTRVENTLLKRLKIVFGAQNLTTYLEAFP